jgi:hypothetical protein
VADFESSPEAATLRRLAALHRRERAPEEFRVRVAQRTARLSSAQTQAHAEARLGASTRLIRWVPLLAAAAAIVIWFLAHDYSLVPEREASRRPARAAPVSFRGKAVPGSLRWRKFGAPSGDGTSACEYRFGLRPDGAQPELRVLWTECEFPDPLREVTVRRMSSATDRDVRVFVAGSWSESGELRATELRVLAR